MLVAELTAKIAAKVSITGQAATRVVKAPAVSAGAASDMKHSVLKFQCSPVGASDSSELAALKIENEELKEKLQKFGDAHEAYKVKSDAAVENLEDELAAEQAKFTKVTGAVEFAVDALKENLKEYGVTLIVGGAKQDETDNNIAMLVGLAEAITVKSKDF
jgi:hypothetical protein